MTFSVGDFVKVIDGIELEGGEVSSNWAGRVLEIYPTTKTCLLELDSITLDGLTDSYLLDCIEEGTTPFEYVFEWNDLRISARRDTEKESHVAVEKIYTRMQALDPEDDIEYDRDQQEQWIQEFRDSAHFAELPASQRDDAAFVAETFMEFMYAYELERPEEWTVNALKTVCLFHVPRSISDEMELFHHYGVVLAQFLGFLGDTGHIDNAHELQVAVLAIKDDIPKRASDRSNWGMTKSLLWGGGDTDYDIKVQADLETDAAPSTQPLRHKDPFQHLGRNEKISVRYADGTLKKGIKFKLVERDLRDGKCAIVR